MTDLPGELEDSERSVEGSIWGEVRGGLRSRPEPGSPVQPGSIAQRGSRDSRNTTGAHDSAAAIPPLHLDQSDHWLGRIALYYVAHPTIPNLYQCCFDYVEPWDWSRQTERIATGRWIYRTTEQR